MLWGEFGLYLILIIFFGWKLSVMADELCVAKNLGKGLVGFVLLGFATSLPELITTMTSVLYIGNSSLGAGNIIGSNNANMFILFISLITVTSLMKEGKTDRENLVSISYLFVIIGVFVAGAAMDGAPEIGGLSIHGFIIAALFLLSIKAMKLAGDQEKSQTVKMKEKFLGGFFYIKLSVTVLFLVLVSWRISFVVDEMALYYSWSSTSAGALFLAWATSLPELVVTVSAIIIGAKELGIGNILGSNVFNMMILALSDIFSGRDSTVFILDKKLLFLTGILIVMSAGLVVMLSNRENKKIFGIAVIPAIMIAMYVAGMIYSF